MSADPENSGPSSGPPAKRPRPERITLERQQTRELLEVHITLPVVLEALEFAIASEPEPGDMPPDAEQSPDIPPAAAPSRFRLLYDLMLDPAFTPFSFEGARPRAAIDTLMSRANVRLPELLALIGQRNLAMAIARSAERVGRVIDGLGEFAEPRSEPCLTCDEQGRLPGENEDEGAGSVLCPDCRGRRFKRHMGNLEAAKLFVGIHGGITNPKGAGGAGAGGASSIINVMANATVKSSKDQTNGPETVTARVQKLIEQ